MIYSRIVIPEEIEKEYLSISQEYADADPDAEYDETDFREYIKLHASKKLQDYLARHKKSRVARNDVVYAE